MKILNIGSCNIDYVYTLDHIVKAGETQATYNLELFSGGKGLNQSIAAAKAGAEIYHAGCIGYDGKMLTDTLKDNGVDISLVKTADTKTGHAIIQVSNAGENSIFLYSGSNMMITKNYIDSVLENFESGDIILLQNEISNVDYIVEKAYKKGMTIMFNPSPFNREIEKIDLNKISFLILNEVEANCFSGCEETNGCIEFFEKNYPKLKVVLTFGKNGSVYCENGNKYYQPAYEVKTVDTTATGDTFTGYFAAGILKGDDITKVLGICAAASALAASRKGAAPSIPVYSEALNALKHLKTNKKSPKTARILKETENYIEQNIGNATLGGLAVCLGYTKSHTEKLVKKVTGTAFGNLLQKKRCDKAADMLLNTDLSIKEIIDFVGYKNENFFRKKFKERYGKNPLDFRKGASD